MVICLNCRSEKAAVRRPKTGDAVCRSCFLNLFETEVHRTIIAYNLFEPGETVAIGVSGGKDSSVVLHVLDLLNQRYQYGVNLVMVAIDEGIVGYRDHSLEAVHEQQRKYKLPLKILSYDELFGWTMDKVVALTGKKGNCTYCGVFRRQSLEKGAVVMGASKLVTGHNADDAAETILMNLLRGDIARLQRCTHPLSGARDELPRVKPLYYSYEKEIVLYARFRNLQYFATECIYAPNSYRGHARTFIKLLERLRPRSITDILASGQFLSKICKSLHQNSSQNYKNRAKIMQISGGRLSIQTRSTCQKCGSISSQPICYACSLLDILRRLNSPGLKNDVQYISVDRRTIESNAKTKEIACIEDLVTENSTKKKTCACDES